ncbi:MAG: acyl-CoA/acyl-ACP dehydrogenase [Candidatus Aminicenantes bacterium]|nr:acyl-CoA/acyl-ACP dehydrogenase [Candidatus Aminicenantes bacterium]
MDFELNEEQKMIKEAVAELAQAEIKPYVKKIDEEKKIPDSIIKGLADLGILGMTVSPEFGGSAADPVTTGVVAEELAKADFSCAVPTFFLVQCAWGYVLDKYGQREAKEAILPWVTKGQAFLGIASTEPEAGSDVANIKTRADKRDKAYILNGEKMFISGLAEILNQLPKGGGYVTLAKTEFQRGAKGISLFYVPVKGTRGISPTYLEEWGRRGISTGGFAMEDVVIPENYLIGQENKGFYYAMEGFDLARALIAVVSSSAAQSALSQAMDYLKIRQAFGQPIGKFEGLQFKVAENWAKLEAAKLLGYRALWTYGEEQRGKKSRWETTRLCAEAKMLAPVFAFEAINEAIQCFGAFGYTEECPLHLALRGVRSYYWAEGTVEIMKIIVGRELLGKEFIAYR